MLTEVCKHINNWFDTVRYFGTITIEDNVVYITSKRGIFVTGDIPVRDYIQTGQYFRVVGSLFNDGVYTMPPTDLRDETFEGAIWAMAVPPAVIALADEIEAWVTKYGEGAASPYQSESFGGYSYTKASGGTGAAVSSWQEAFRTRLNAWRKI